MMPNSVGVLLIEDDPAVLLGTQQTLQLAGFEVEPFADAESAIPSIVPGVPAIVVCDVKLPGLDGLGLLVRAQSIDKDLAIIRRLRLRGKALPARPIGRNGDASGRKSSPHPSGHS